MYNKLTKKEIRIIEETKREGEELRRQEGNGGKEEKTNGWGLVKSILVFILFFTLLAFGARLILSLVS